MRRRVLVGSMTWLVMPVVLAAAVVVGSARVSHAPTSAGRGHALRLSRHVPSIPMGLRSGPTRWRALNHAIHRLPTYHPRWARWVVGGPSSWWSTTDWYARVIYIHRSVPTDRLYSVAAHEWGHILEARAYDGNIVRMVRRLHRYYGGSGLMGAEYAADCMAKVQGATWTHYTSCTRHSWRHGARRLLRGRPL